MNTPERNVRPYVSCLKDAHIRLPAGDPAHSRGQRRACKLHLHGPRLPPARTVLSAMARARELAWSVLPTICLTGVIVGKLIHRIASLTAQSRGRAPMSNARLACLLGLLWSLVYAAVYGFFLAAGLGGNADAGDIGRNTFAACLGAASAIVFAHALPARPGRQIVNFFQIGLIFWAVLGILK